jgi:FKBP-type peptidyl-prolyl cis-trans isomerase (trigger factor)
MVKCIRCGKGSLFFKVNVNGICKDCERIEKLEAEENQLKSRIEQLATDYAQAEKSYKEIIQNRDKLYTEIAEKAKNDALAQISVMF